MRAHVDFGLAKLKEDLPSPIDAMTAMRVQPLTGEGRIVGTVSYMSPEQAEGKLVDHRSDTFSVGVMLYEMATGERPFKGDSCVSTLSSILRDAPRPVTEINPSLPRDLAKIIRRLLTKDPEHRYQSAKDLRNELEELKQELDSGELAAPSAVAPMGRKRSGTVWMLAGAGAIVIAMVAAAAWLATVWLRPGQPASAPIQVTSTLRITSAAGIKTDPSLSPDGRKIAGFAGRTSSIWVYSFDTKSYTRIVEGSVPVWLSDSRRLVYHSGGKLLVVDTISKQPREILAPRPGEKLSYPGVAPDSRFLYYTHGTTDADIWLMTIK